MADGQLFKPEKDYTKDVDKQIPEAEELAQVTLSMKPKHYRILTLASRAMFQRHWKSCRL